MEAPYWIALAVLLFILPFGFIIIAGVRKSNKRFIKRAEQLKKGMAFEEVLSLMGRPAIFDEGKKYIKCRWEEGRIARYSNDDTLYVTVIFENDILIIIDRNF